MIKELKYSGYTAVPSDYECQDGTLAASLNLICEEQQLKSITQPEPIDIGLSNTQKVMYIHQTSSFVHYIFIDGTDAAWMDKPSSITSKTAARHLHTFYSEIYQFTSVGNTLLALCEDGMHYFLWKGEQKEYLYLGTHLPELPLSFGLQATVCETENFLITYDSFDARWGSTDDTDVNLFCTPFSDANKTKITAQVLAKVNKFIAEESTKKGKFIFPFFVRYAYRLYDGTLTMHSAPILMTASTDICPEAAVTQIDYKGSLDTDQCYITIFMATHELDYSVAVPTKIAALDNWKDIISSVDIFVSKPIYTYDQNGECTQFEFTEGKTSSYSVCKLMNSKVPENIFPQYYQKHSFGELYGLYKNDLDHIYRFRVKLPEKSHDSVKEEIKNVSLFYLLDSIKIDDLKTERTKINVKEDYLLSLVTREVMTDDYDSHDTLIATKAFPYNNRLNITDIKKKLYNTYNTASLTQFTDGYVVTTTNNGHLIPDTTWAQTHPYTVFFHIRQDGKEIVVEGEPASLTVGDVGEIKFLFYPNINAYKATVVYYNYFFVSFELKLEKHATLNGAFYFNGWENPDKHVSTPSPSQDVTVNLPNKIYTSEINNPYFFPVTSVNTIGTGRIIGMSTAAKALSEGQFGQFPLYAFTTDGVWALEVSATGAYSARQPITRDVCINPGSITQIDNAVLFVTDRGLMLISGSETQCISDEINSEFPFNALELPKFEKLHAMLGHTTDTCFPTKPFLSFINDCGILYDYTHQHIIVFNKKISYAYVYSLKSKLWGMIYSTIEQALNSYPEALAIDHDGHLLDFSNGTPDEYEGLFITRPLKLDMPDVHKTVDTIIQRGHFRKSCVKSILYGSRDLINWHLVWSSTDHFLRGFRGTPYKYFRIACITSLSEDENIYGASINYTQRMANQLR